MNPDEKKSGATHGWRLHEARGQWKRAEGGSLAPILCAVGLLVLLYLLLT